MMPVLTNSTPSYYTSDTSLTSGTMWGSTEADLNAEILDASEDAASLGEDEFLKLLMAQMQHQDPLNPTDNTEFVAQLAQFSSLEQMTSMNENLGTMIDANLLIADSINNSMLVSYLGKNVDAVSQYFNFDGETPVDITFYAEKDIVSGQIHILDGNDTIIRSIDIADLRSGKNVIEWNGMTAGGNMSDSGGYYYNVEAWDIGGAQVSITPKFNGIVDGVTYMDNTAYLRVGEIMIPFDGISTITETAVTEDTEQ